MYFCCQIVAIYYMCQYLVNRTLTEVKDNFNKELAKEQAENEAANSRKSVKELVLGKPLNSKLNIGKSLDEATFTNDKGEKEFSKAWTNED